MYHDDMQKRHNSSALVMELHLFWMKPSIYSGEKKKRDITWTSVRNSTPPLDNDYSTGVQIVSCTLSDDSVLSESTGLFNPVLCVSQWNLFWQKNQPMRLCLSNQLRPGREWFPSPLDDFNRLFEGLIGELFKIWHWNMFYFFKWHKFGP